MVDKTTYTLWLGPSGDMAERIQNRIQALSSSHQTPSFDPHITLLTKVDGELSSIKSRMERLGDSVDPFKLQIKNVSSGGDYYHVVYIVVEKSAPLVKLRKHSSELFDGSKNEYVPHISLIYGDITPELKKDITQDVKGEFTGSIVIDHLLLMKTDGLPRHWKRIHETQF